MNLDADSAPIDEDFPRATFKPARRTRVRHSYPESLIELVGHLRVRMPTREIAAVLDIPRSSVYRWAPIPDTGADWQSLISRCKQDGFSVPPSIADMPASCPATDATTYRRALPATRHAVGGKFAASSRHSQNSVAKCSHVEAARSMIERDYFRHIDSTALAALAGLSRFRFIHAFTAAYNISPHQYLLRVRIDAAKRLLATSRETIDVVAAATGFRSGACLNRAFTRMEGHCISRFCRFVNARP